MIPGVLMAIFFGILGVCVYAAITWAMGDSPTSPGGHKSRRRKVRRLCPKHAKELLPGQVAFLEAGNCDVCKKLRASAPIDNSKKKGQN